MSEMRDDEFDAYLDGRSPVSRRYAALGDEQPPAELDARILAAAAQSAKLVPLERPTRRWGAALAVAATLVLCVSLVMNLTITPDGPLGDGSPAVVEFAEPDPLSRSRPGEAPPAADKSRAQFDALRLQALPGAAPDSGAWLNDSLSGGAGQDAAGLDLSAPAATGRRPAVAAPAPGDAAAMAKRARDEPATPEAETADELSAALQVIRAFVRQPASAAIMSKAESGVESTAAAPARDQEAGPEPGAQQLLQIIAAFDAGDRAQTRLLLDEFVVDFPDHPVSRQLANRP